MVVFVRCYIIKEFTVHSLIIWVFVWDLSQDLRYWQNAERVSTFFKSFNQPSLEQGNVQEDQDFFYVFVPMKNQYQSIFTINLWIYLFEEQERFRDSCFNCREIANQLQLIWKNWHFGCIRLMGRGLLRDGAISGIAFLYWAPQPTSIHPPAGSQSFYPRPQKAATNAPYRWAEGHCSGKMKDIVSIQIFWVEF